jgi:hypothetical protein
MANKNKVLPYILFGVPIAIGVYLLIKSIKDKAKSSGQTPVQQAKKTALDTTKVVLNTVKKAVLPIIKKDNFPLKKGSYGENVKKLQTALMQYNPSLPLGWNDSDFGTKTENELLKVTKGKTVGSQNELDAIVRGGQSKAQAETQSKIDAELKLKNQRLFNQF